MKKTSTGGWAHVLCALLVPSARFENSSFLEPIDLEDVPRGIRKCSFCGAKKAGGIICAYNGCVETYHATCGVRSNLYIDTSNGILYCPDHDPRERVEAVGFSALSPDTRYARTDLDPSVRPSIPIWPRARRRFQALEGIEPRLLAFSANRICLRDLPGVVGSAALIRAVFPIWVVRRKGRSIIWRLRIDTETAGFQGWGAQPPERLRAMIWGLTPSLLPSTLEPNVNKKSSVTTATLPDMVSAAEIDRKKISSGVPCSPGSSSAGVLPAHSYDLQICSFLLRVKHTLLRYLKGVRGTVRAVKREMERRERFWSIFGVAESQKDISLLIDEVAEADIHQIFLEPVTDDIAPNYTRIVAEPISLSGIREKHARRLYTSLNEAIRDLKLMVDNAQKYNGTRSVVGIEAQKIERIVRCWEVKPGDTVLARIVPGKYRAYSVLETHNQGVLSVRKITGKSSASVHYVCRTSVHPVISAGDKGPKKESLIREKLAKLNRYLD